MINKCFVTNCRRSAGEGSVTCGDPRCDEMVEQWKAETPVRAATFEKWKRATLMLRQVSESFGPDQGVTVLLHDASQDPGQWAGIAIATTLPSRKHIRLMLLAAVWESLQADGVTLDEVETVIHDEVTELRHVVVK